jgi:hypothetical protein
MSLTLHKAQFPSIDGFVGASKILSRWKNIVHILQVQIPLRVFYKYYLQLG